MDVELSGTFMQLWRPKSQLLIEGLFEQVAARIMYLHTPGAMQMMADFAACGASTYRCAVWALDIALWRVVHSSACGLDGEYEGVEQICVGF